MNVYFLGDSRDGAVFLEDYAIDMAGNIPLLVGVVPPRGSAGGWADLLPMVIPLSSVLNIIWFESMDDYEARVLKAKT